MTQPQPNKKKHKDYYTKEKAILGIFEEIKRMSPEEINKELPKDLRRATLAAVRLLMKHHLTMDNASERFKTAQFFIDKLTDTKFLKVLGMLEGASTGSAKVEWSKK